MKIPLSLLKEFVAIDLPPQEIAHLLTLAGIEVDKIDNLESTFSHVVVGKILSVEKHPHADKLVIAHVDSGEEILSIVCGASNCQKNMKVALAKIGATLLDEKGKQWKVKKTTLRNVDSYGMLCSAKELQLSEESEGILSLPEEFLVGQDLASLLWDPVFEISLTPNLGHCASALGIARELSALTEKALHPSKIHTLPEEHFSIEEKISVSLEAAPLCPRYGCRLLFDLESHLTTPFWLKRRIELSGFRSLHPLVDIMNYLMIAYGHPMHAFDYDKIEGKQLLIHTNQEIETVIGLDGKEYTLPLDTLLISDAKKPLAIAGILGLENSAISSSTKNVLIEAAYFDPSSIRKSCKALALKTESSFRFERGTDINVLPLVLNHAAFLIHSICKGTIARGAIDLYPRKMVPISIPFRTEKARRFLNIPLNSGEIEKIFHRLDMHTKQEKELMVTPPSYRNDIKKEIDLMEEVARIFGYNNIEKKIPFYSSSSLAHTPIYLFEKEMRKVLSSLQLQELMSSDLISPRFASICEEMQFSKTILIEVLHSKSADYSILRPSLLLSLLQVVQFNFDHQQEGIAGYEIGKVHFKKQDRLIEENVLGFILSGKRAPHYWKEKGETVDFYDLKGLLENFLSSLGLSHVTFTPSSFPFLHPTRQVRLMLEKEEIGVAGEVHPLALQKMDISEKAYFAELNTNLLLEAKKTKVRYREISAFPSSKRDLTFVLPPHLSYAQVHDLIQQHRSPLLEHFFLLDLYEDPLSLQKKITFRFIYRNKAKTITVEEVEKEHDNLFKKISVPLAMQESLENRSTTP